MTWSDLLYFIVFVRMKGRLAVEMIYNRLLIQWHSSSLIHRGLLRPPGSTCQRRSRKGHRKKATLFSMPQDDSYKWVSFGYFLTCIRK